MEKRRRGEGRSGEADMEKRRSGYGEGDMDSGYGQRIWTADMDSGYGELRIENCEAESYFIEISKLLFNPASTSFFSVSNSMSPRSLSSFVIYVLDVPAMSATCS